MLSEPVGIIFGIIILGIIVPWTVIFLTIAVSRRQRQRFAEAWKKSNKTRNAGLASGLFLIVISGAVSIVGRVPFDGPRAPLVAYLLLDAAMIGPILLITLLFVRWSEAKYPGVWTSPPASGSRLKALPREVLVRLILVSLALMGSLMLGTSVFSRIYAK